MDYHFKDSLRTLAKAVVRKCKGDGIGEVRGMCGWAYSHGWACHFPVSPPPPKAFSFAWDDGDEELKGWSLTLCVFVIAYVFQWVSLCYMFLPPGKCPSVFSWTSHCTVCSFVACVCVCGCLSLSCQQSQGAGDTRSVTGGYTPAHTHPAECKTA